MENTTPPTKATMSPFSTSSTHDNVVESSDIGGKPPNILTQLLERMSPRHCLGSTHGGSSTSCHDFILQDDPVDFDGVMPTILRDVRKDRKLRVDALRKLYQMTDRERKQNRVPIVCTTKWDTIGALTGCILPEEDSMDRRLALLLLNNLSIPMENKAAILLGEPAEVLLPALLKVIHARLPSAYLATVCLFNLSYLEDAKEMLLQYVPSDDQVVYTRVQSEYHHRPPIENPNSLVRILEKLLQDYTPYISHSSHSVEKQAVRWAVGILRNLVTVEENAIALARKTSIPSLALQYLSESTNDLSLWARDSLEDSSLLLLVNLAKHPECCSCVDLAKAQQSLGKLQGKGGIHDVRATAVLGLLVEASQSKKIESVEVQDEKKQVS